MTRPPENEKGEPGNLLEFKTTIKAEDTYFLIYGRLDRQEEQRRKRAGDNRPPGNGEILKQLDEEIKLIFLDYDPKTDLGKTVDPEMEIDYMTYLRRVNKQALNKRQEGKEKRKVQKDATTI